MEKLSTRRAALRALASLPALALPAIAIASPVNPDAALLAMQPAIDAADREFDKASAALAAAQYACRDMAPERPTKPDGPCFSAEEQKKLDELVALTKARGPSPEWAAYEQAARDWITETERFEDEHGVTAAGEGESAALGSCARVRDALVETPATTLAGLIFKARYAAAHYSDDYDESVTISIVDDLLAMAGDSAA